MNTADLMVEHYRSAVPVEVQQTMDGIVAALADELGESPEAWRGAEVMVKATGTLVITASNEADDEYEKRAWALLAQMQMVLTASFLDHPAMRALRAEQ